MRRPEFITLLGGAALSWSRSTRAQQPDSVRRIGVLVYLAREDAEGQGHLSAFVHALKELGWSDGVQIETRWARADAVHKHTAELLAPAPDVLLAATGTATVAALLQAARNIPIVLVTVIDPVGAGFVASFGRLQWGSLEAR